MHPNHKRPIWILKVVCLELFFIVMGITTSYSSCMADMSENKKTAPADTVKNIQFPENLSPSEVDAYLASLDDKQARQVLALKLKDEAARNSVAQVQGNGDLERGKLWTFFDNLEDKASIIEKRFYSSIFNIATGSGKWGAALDRLSDNKGGGRFLLTLLVGGVLIFNSCLRPYHQPPCRKLVDSSLVCSWMH